MKIIKTIALLLMTNVVFSQNNIVNKKRKIVKKNVRWIDIDSLMQTLPKDTYYYNPPHKHHSLNLKTIYQ